MRALKFLLQKEFLQIFRNRTILLVIFIVPIVQLVLLPWAADYEVRNINIAVADHDHSEYARKFILKVTSSGYFRLDQYGSSHEQAFRELELERADIVIDIPPHFEKELIREDHAVLLLSVNAVNGVKAILGSSYLQSIIGDFNSQIRVKWIQEGRGISEPTINIRSSNWYNPLLNYKYFMVPGILVMLVTIVGSFLTALNIVREKDMGTIEQLNVSPIKKYHFILGKLIPFWILGILILTIGLVISWLLYGIIPVGSLWVIYLFSGIYLFAILGYGLLISIYARSQQQAMLVTFFLFMIFILLAGLYTPVESMPVWAQWFIKINPVAYYIDVMRLVMLKGSSLLAVVPHLFIVLSYGVFLNGWALLAYRKRSV